MFAREESRRCVVVEKRNVRRVMYIKMHRLLSRINLIFNIKWRLHLDCKCEMCFTSEVVFYGPVRVARSGLFVN